MDQLHKKNPESVKMNKDQFMKELKEYLAFLKGEDVKDILEDYEEHFAVGKKKKRKESEIAKSLGSPKDIAKEVRANLRKNETILPFELFAVNFWVTAKDLTLQIFGYAKDWLKGAEKEVKEVAKSGNAKRIANDLKLPIIGKTLLILFNVLVFIWIWIALLITLISFYISSVAVILSGFVTAIASLFVLINPVGFMLKNLSFSSLFAGIGIMFIGILLFMGINQLTKGFAFVSKAYMKWNRRVLGGKSK